MDDRIAFLNARLDEDEHYLQTMIEAGERYAALATAKDTADVYGMAMAVADDPQVRKLLVQAMEGVFRPPNDLHQALREVAAKRAILVAYEANDSDTELHLGPYPRKHGEWDGLRLAVRHLVSVYSDHPDYRQEWKAE